MGCCSLDGVSVCPSGTGLGHVQQKGQLTVISDNCNFCQLRPQTSVICPTVTVTTKCNMSLNCNYLQLDMLQLSEVTVGRSYSCLWLQLAEVTVVCGYSLQKLQLTFYTRFQNGPRALT